MYYTFPAVLFDFCCFVTVGHTEVSVTNFVINNHFEISSLFWGEAEETSFGGFCLPIFFCLKKRIWPRITPTSPSPHCGFLEDRTCVFPSLAKITAQSLCEVHAQWECKWMKRMHFPCEGLPLLSLVDGRTSVQHFWQSYSCLCSGNLPVGWVMVSLESWRVFLPWILPPGRLHRLFSRKDNSPQVLEDMHAGGTCNTNITTNAYALSPERV